jgi:uncharacterized protein (DUF1697 family)
MKKNNMIKLTKKKETMTEKKYNNIQDVSLINLYKMLTLKQFQDKDHQKMINDEINFRNNPITLDQLENLFKGQLVKLSKVL